MRLMYAQKTGCHFPKSGIGGARSEAARDGSETESEEEAVEGQFAKWRDRRDKPGAEAKASPVGVRRARR